MSDPGLMWTDMAWSLTGSPKQVVDAGLSETRTYVHDTLERLVRVERDAPSGAEVSYSVFARHQESLQLVVGTQGCAR